MSCLDDDTLVALAEGELDAALQTEALRHIEACATCAALMGAAARLAAGEELALGRYEVIEELGVGGMGRVFLAYDPVLEREVAVKVVAAHAIDPKRGASRLVQEAQSLARMNHPAIVKVFDVQEHDGAVFIAMEFLRGRTLGGWMAQGPSEDAVARTFAEAGEALAAAHEAGLVHRDFKPANVIVNDDGHPVVLDFGLARPREIPASDDSNATESSSKGSATAYAGTPVYMAPEQYDGTSSAASDQYAFCLTYLEALCRRFPFDLEDATALRRAKRQCALAKGVLDHIPTRIKRVLLRGLAPDPRKRWPTMRAALWALRRKRGRALVVGLGVAASALAGAGAYALGSADAVDCSQAGAAVASTWNEDRRDRLRGAFLESGAEDAARLSEQLQQEIEARTDELAEGYGAACEARHERRELADADFDARVRCYDRQLRRIDAAVVATQSLDASTAENAATLLKDAPRPVQCADADFLASVGDRPSDPRVAAAIDAIEGELATANTEVRLGRYREAEPLFEAALSKAKELEHDPTLARALVGFAVCLRKLDDPRARELATQAHGLSRLVRDYRSAAKAALELLHFTRRRGKIAEAGQWAEEAEADAKSLGVPEITARVREAQASLAMRGNDFTEAARLNAEVQRIHKKIDPSSRGYGTALRQAAVILRRQERFTEALATMREAEVILTAIYGADSPKMTGIVGELGHIHMLMDKVDEGLPYLERAVVLAEKKTGPQSKAAMTARAALGMGLRNAGRHAEAETALRTATEVLKHIEHGPREAGVVWLELGKVLALQKKQEEARVVFDKALGLVQSMEEGPARTDLTRVTLTQIGALEAAQGNLAVAEEFRDRAQALRQPQ